MTWDPLSGLLGMRPAGRPSWDEYFLGIAQAVAVRADCTRRKIGAVLVGPDHVILSTGYNGAPAGEPGCASAGACPRGRFTHAQIAVNLGTTHPTPCVAIHAEDNALRYASDIPEGSTMYVTTAPCPDCAQALRDRHVRVVHS